MSACVLLSVVAAHSAEAQAAEIRPTIAVMSFSGGAMQKPSEYSGLGQGIAELLATALASNSSVRVVERAKLGAVLEEQKLAASQQVDPETAAQLGRVLGANHFITGGFLIDSKERIRLDVRSVNVETSEIEYRHTMNGTASKLFELIDRLGRDVNAGLHLKPARAQSLSGARPEAVGDQRRAIALYGQALAALDKGDSLTALAAAREAVREYGGLISAQDLVKSIEKPRVP